MTENSTKYRKAPKIQEITGFKGPVGSLRKKFIHQSERVSLENFPKFTPCDRVTMNVRCFWDSDGKFSKQVRYFTA